MAKGNTCGQMGSYMRDNGIKEGSMGMDYGKVLIQILI
jgi:hypothetical protein